VDKNQLNSLLNHYSGSSLQEAEGVSVLSGQYPYSQLLHVLAARTAKDHHWVNQQQVLQLAAVYSTDRSVLKEIMSVEYQPVSLSSQVAEAEVKEKQPSAYVKSSPGSIDYADEILRDIERLRELKHNFEVMFMGEDDSSVQQVAEITEQLTREEEPTPKTSVEEEKKQMPSKKISKRQRLIELAKQLEAEETTPEEKKKAPKKSNDSNPLIDEIKATKKKVEPENSKTKEQIEVINQFIKSKPVLSPPKVTPPDETLDLASTLKSGEFGDKIISETLAEILIRQGKKEKAIEVYKKLIWKFPQKKAYFAAQIEELRK
jgi:tetratricopeptide (TPR) repeat protein